MSEAPKLIQFLESHRPPLDAGEYRLYVTQDLSKTAKVSDSFGGKKPYTFEVAGPKYSLSPQEIAAVFPPPGSLGDHDNVLPHVALRRSTLPWERSGAAKDEADVESGDWEKAPPPGWRWSFMMKMMSRGVTFAWRSPLQARKR